MRLRIRDLRRHLSVPEWHAIGSQGCLAYLDLQEVLRYAVDLFEALCMRFSSGTGEACGNVPLSRRLAGRAMTIGALLHVGLWLLLCLGRRVDGSRVDALHPDESPNSSSLPGDRKRVDFQTMNVMSQNGRRSLKRDRYGEERSMRPSRGASSGCSMGRRARVLLPRAAMTLGIEMAGGGLGLGLSEQD